MAPGLHLPPLLRLFKHVYCCIQQISDERLQDHWSSGLLSHQFGGQISPQHRLQSVNQQFTCRDSLILSIASSG